MKLGGIKSKMSDLYGP